MKENKILYGACKLIYSTLLKVLYRPSVIGIENIPESGPIIFAGNHRHAFDPVVVMTYTKRIVHYMAKESLFKGIHGFLFEQIGLIKVYRTRNNPQAIENAVELLKQGGTLGIFPEGTRNKTEEDLLRFKHGAVAIAKEANAPIIPFAIKGEYKIFKKKLIIEFGKPVDVNNMEIEVANDYIRNEVLNLLRK
ncbi:MAG: 1-acyl-sn-glycerol-3-phosphate acyltransferase [Clostridia bacterium]|nr:1-acyl-sn-glycerol-3-phosphate acyltransferase [Clostridia bacterium]